MALFSLNVCKFRGCYLYFSTLSELIQHIEEIHASDAEFCRRNDFDILNNQSNAASSRDSRFLAPPLCLIYRCFPKLPPQKARSIPHQPFKVSFCKYRKRYIPPSHPVLQNAIINRPISRVEQEQSHTNESLTAELHGLSRASYKGEDRRHQCPVEGCNKRYKNLQGAKHHARVAHSLNEDAFNVLTSNVVSRPIGSMIGVMQSAGSKTPSTRQFKCVHCTKRYKTMIGLSNHMQHTHHKISVTACTGNLSSTLVPVSPSAVPSSASSHSHSSGANVETYNPPSMPNISSGSQNLLQNVCFAVSYNNTSQVNITPGVRMNTQGMSTVGSHHQYQQLYAPTKGTTVQNTGIQIRTVGSVLGAPRLSSSLPYHAPIGTGELTEQQPTQIIPIKSPHRFTAQTSLGRPHQQLNTSIAQRVRMPSNYSTSTAVNIQYSNMNTSNQTATNFDPQVAVQQTNRNSQ